MTTAEFRRIAAIRERLARARSDVRISIGDDAAVLEPTGHAQAMSVDVAIEDVHFRRSWATWRELGRRAFVAAVSDLAAMAAEPRIALLSLVLPPAFDDAMLAELIDGVADGASEYDSAIVGGNLAAGNQLSITTTVVGNLRAAPLERAGAAVREGIYVTGQVGAAALGLALLGAGHDGTDALERPFVTRWRRPTAQILTARRLQGTASAAIDISDGLVQDLGHLCEASGVGARVFAAELPLLAGHDDVARRLGLDPLMLALTGGEDYELLFTAPISTVAKGVATLIGRICDASEGVQVLGPDGNPVPVEHGGWDHFARSASPD